MGHMIRYSVALCAFLLAMLDATSALGQISVLGVRTFPWAPRYDVAYDSVNDVYLLITEGPPVRGQFVNRDGAPVGPAFTISLEPGNPFVAWSTVAFGGTPQDPTFLVTYLAIEGAAVPKYGRLVRYNGGAGALVSNRSTILGDVKNEWYAAERSRSIWHGNQFVVSTRVLPAGYQFPQTQLNHFSLAGQVSPAQILGDGLDYQGGPSLACAPDGMCIANGYAQGWPFGGNTAIWARRFSAATLQPLGGQFYLDDQTSPVDTPWVVYASHTGKFVSAWYRRTGGRIDFRLTGADGTMGPLDKNRSFGGGAGEPQLVYNSLSRTSVLLTKWSPPSNPQGADFYAVEIGDDGYPLQSSPPLLITPWDGLVLEYRPSLAASTRDARWLATYVLADGVRAAVIQGNAQQTGNVTLSPSSLAFSITKSGSDIWGFSPQSVAVSFSGVTGPLTWTASTSVPWLQVTGGSGDGNGTFAVTVVNPGDVIGSQTSLNGAITLTAPSAPNSPVTLPVSLSVSPAAPPSAPPFGSFDTPVHLSTVNGTIAVAGWALDDKEIDRVEVWRDLIPNDPAPPFIQFGHPASGKVFVATGTFVAGTRPDVHAAYPTTPFSHRAGWGYPLLTWGFPDANGTFVLTAIAWDKDGQHSVLGSKTITVNNAAATKPFGSIDLPANGGVFSGYNWTFGWALTPNLGCNMANGQLYMTMNSAPPYFPVSYGDYRADIATLFPGFPDSANASGAVALNSFNYPNGTHQIGWLAYDSCGNGEGIGSRFFTISNVTSLPMQVEASERPTWDPAGRPTFEVLGALRPVPGAMALVRGIATPALSIEPGATVRLGQTGRLEIHATPPGTETDPRVRYSAHLDLEGQLQRIPLGSSFDSDRGVFHWQPVAGFLGRFPLVVVRYRDGVPADYWTVSIVVGPGLDQSLLEIDRSADVIEGWALDPLSTAGSGIGAVHIWATPASGSLIARRREPIFLGSARQGVSRPDVAESYGAQFGTAGFSLPLTGLAPGDYDVVVYAWSLRNGRWDVAREVRVRVR